MKPISSKLLDGLNKRVYITGHSRRSRSSQQHIVYLMSFLLQLGDALVHLAAAVAVSIAWLDWVAPYVMIVSHLLLRTSPKRYSSLRILLPPNKTIPEKSSCLMSHIYPSSFTHILQFVQGSRKKSQLDTGGADGAIPGPVPLFS